MVPLVSPVTLDQIVKLNHRVARMEIFRGTDKTQLRFQNGRELQRRVFQPPAGQVPNPAPAPDAVPRDQPYETIGSNGADSARRSAETKPYLSPLPSTSQVSPNTQPLLSPAANDQSSQTGQMQSFPSSYLKLMDVN